MSIQFTVKLGATAKIGLPKGTKLTATPASGKAVVFTLDEDYSTSFDGTANGVVAIEDDGWTCPRVVTNGSVCSKAVSNAKVTAAAAGEDYNIGAMQHWDNLDDEDETIRISNPKAITGGTTRNVTIVTQANIDSAKERILASHTAEGRAALMDQINTNDVVVIESSFAAEATDVKAKPEVNAEVDENTKPEITIKAVYSIYTVEKSKIEEYAKATTKVAEDQRIYSVSDPYFERYNSIDEPVRLKAVIKTGPTVTEEDILEKAKGKKLGEVQSLLRSINGVSSVNITPSFFWVRTVPTDDSKITIELTVEDK